MRLIGITGFIGSGKTTVGKIIKDLGYVVFDMDVWCRNMYKDEGFLNIIKQNFPNAFENDIFCKRKLREFVFFNHQALQKLESLTHPYLKNKLLETIHKNKLKPYLFFVETALLYQMNLEKFCDSVIITKAPFDTMLQRTIIRDNIKQKDFISIIEKQNIEVRQKKPYYEINTDQSLVNLRKDVIQTIERILLEC